MADFSRRLYIITYLTDGVLNYGVLMDNKHDVYVVSLVGILALSSVLAITILGLVGCEIPKALEAVMFSSVGGLIAALPSSLRLRSDHHANGVPLK